MAPPPMPPKSGLERPAPTAGLGLQPLPSPQQVTQAVPQGRIDPFSDPRPPVPTAPSRSAAGSPPPGVVPPGGDASSAGGPGAKATPHPTLAAAPVFQLTGVIQSGGRPEAIVVMGGQSDSLRIGQEGSHQTPLLPPGWSVDAININACSLVLKKGGLLHTYKCADS